MGVKTKEMNRIHLYRGKRLDNGQFIEGSLIGEDVIVGKIVEFEEDYFTTEFWYKVDPETVGQYTGIDDREGDKIFEGDIFKIGAEENIYTVKFDYGCFLAYEDDIQVGILAELSTMFIKKIGNIYDNSELLK